MNKIWLIVKKALASRILAIIFISLPTVLYAQTSNDIPLLPEVEDAIDEYGVLLTGESTTSGLITLSSTDIVFPKSGQYSNLSVVRQMRYIDSSIGNSQFARHGYHNFDIVMSCGGCNVTVSSLDQGPYQGGFIVAGVNLFGARYNFSAYFGTKNRIYDTKGSGNIIERYIESGKVHYRFIRNDGLSVSFLFDNNPSVYGPRMYYADKVIYKNGEELRFSYDDLLTYSGSLQYRKRLKGVRDMFDNELQFSYLRAGAQPDPQDIDAHRTINKIEGFKGGQSIGYVTYQYQSFASESNSSYRYIPRAISSITSTMFNENRNLEYYTNNYGGSTLFIWTDIYPSQVDNYSRFSNLSYSVSLVQSGQLSLTVTPLGAETTSYDIRTVGCNPNTVYSCTFYDPYPSLRRVTGGVTTSYYMKDYPTYYYGVFDNSSDPNWLDHPWTQQAYCDIDEAGTFICPYNRLLSRKVLPDGRQISYDYDGLGRLKKMTVPENNAIEYSYNERGFVTVRSKIGKDGVARLDEHVVYPADCSNTVNCNSPIYVLDFKQSRTDFDYSPVHGGLLKKTLPADANGVRPQTRYGYAQRYAWVKSGSAFVQTATPVWMLISEEYCKTSAADMSGNCGSGASDEVVTTYEYENGSTTKGSSLLLLGMAVTADGQTLRTCYGYDQYGRRISETQPRADLASCQ